MPRKPIAEKIAKVKADLEKLENEKSGYYRSSAHRSEKQERTVFVGAAVWLKSCCPTLSHSRTSSLIYSLIMSAKLSLR
jgi:hypothetical protein